MKNPEEEYSKVQEAVSFLKSRIPFSPRVGVILGTGIAKWLDTLQPEWETTFGEVPQMIPSRVASHPGRICMMRINGVPVMIMGGRIHYYEGYEMSDVVRPVRILQGLGCTHLITTNAAGGLHPEYQPGQLVVIRDHINLMQTNPLRGPNERRWGPRFPDLLNAYDPAWIQYCLAKAHELGMQVSTGVYAGNTGPSLETPAEYEFLHRIGADLVGMSAVPEVIAARHIGLKVLAVSVVSNVCYPPERIQKTTVEEVIRVVETSAMELGKLVNASLSFVQEE